MYHWLKWPSSSQAIEEEFRIIYEVGFNHRVIHCAAVMLLSLGIIFCIHFNLLLYPFSKSITFNYIATLGIKQMLYNLDMLSTEVLT